MWHTSLRAELPALACQRQQALEALGCDYWWRTLYAQWENAFENF